MFLRLARVRALAQAPPAELSLLTSTSPHLFVSKEAHVVGDASLKSNTIGGGVVTNINTIFWDVGGVLLSNAWDHNERRETLERFGLDADEFERRHASVIADFETGRLTLQQYLDCTVFYRDVPFSRDEFRQFMLSRSQPKPETLALARALAATGKYLMSTLNNESTELNEYRIRQFGLKEMFDLFVSSCFVQLRKPNPEIYVAAMNLTQSDPDECCFIDDRPENLQPASQLGMHCIQVRGAANLRNDLNALGIEVG
jgi:putative hydrolase of the HAD superfamily